MMRRLLTLWLTVVYLALGVGVPAYAHICGGEAVKHSLLVPTGGCAGEDEEEGGCCREHKHLVKVDAPQKHQVNAWQPMAPQPLALAPALVLCAGPGDLFEDAWTSTATPAETGYGGLPPPVPLYIQFSCLKLGYLG